MSLVPDSSCVRKYQLCLRDLISPIYHPNCFEQFLGVEIGVAMGSTSELLLRWFPEMYLFMVDCWRSFSSTSAYRVTGDKRSRLSEEEQQNRYESVLKRTEFALGRAIPVRALSVDAATMFRCMGAKFNFVFIDGDHSYEGVLSDLEAWHPLVKAGGLFCGHDYNHHKYRGVRKAVDDFHTRMGIELKTGGPETSIWYSRK